MEQLRPTVKRDLSLFSVKAWQDGFMRALPQKLDWQYPIVFNFDGRRVNFYHLQSDFQYFKEHVTRRLIDNSGLFEELNQQFLLDVTTAKQLLGSLDNVDTNELVRLIGDIMSIYIFVVSDAFITAVPAAWESRHESEGVLYQLDVGIEDLLCDQMKQRSLPKELAHVLLPSEVTEAKFEQEINIEQVQKRLQGYILWDDQLITDQPFIEFCSQQGWAYPETKTQLEPIEAIRGAVAFQGQAKGRVVVVHNSRDLESVREGDILVSVMTNVNYLPAFKRAAAVITDEGGVTCHAAILARELAKPCVIGTKVATRLLRTGEVVMVDAINGVVTPISSK